MNGYFDLREHAMDKRSEMVQRIKALVDAEYEGGRTTAMGDMELEEMVRNTDVEAYISALPPCKNKTA